MNDREITKNMSRSPSNNNSLTIQQYYLFQNRYKQPDYDRRISFEHSASKVIDNTKKTRLGIPMHPVPDITTKIIENAHRYLQIAFAEDLYLYCQANNINFAELRDSLNTKWNVNILEPREGIGGVAVVVGLVRIQHTHLTHPKETIVRLAIMPPFAALWFATTYMHATTYMVCVYVFSPIFDANPGMIMNKEHWLCVPK